jgi:hypothetical protein
LVLQLLQALELVLQLEPVLLQALLLAALLQLRLLVV